MTKFFVKPFTKWLYRYLVLWPMAILRKMNFHRYHKRWALGFTVYVVVSTLIAIENQADGTWPLCNHLFYVAVFAFVFAFAELMLVFDQHYKEDEECEAVSRSISYCGVALVIITMCELYWYAVKI